MNDGQKDIYCSNPFGRNGNYNGYLDFVLDAPNLDKSGIYALMPIGGNRQTLRDRYNFSALDTGFFFMPQYIGQLDNPMVANQYLAQVMPSYVFSKRHEVIFLLAFDKYGRYVESVFKANDIRQTEWDNTPKKDPKYEMRRIVKNLSSLPICFFYEESDGGCSKDKGLFLPPGRSEIVITDWSSRIDKDHARNLYTYGYSLNKLTLAYPPSKEADYNFKVHMNVFIKNDEKLHPRGTIEGDYSKIPNTDLSVVNCLRYYIINKWKKDAAANEEEKDAAAITNLLVIYGDKNDCIAHHYYVGCFDELGNSGGDRRLGKTSFPDVGTAWAYEGLWGCGGEKDLEGYLQVWTQDGRFGLNEIGTGRVNNKKYNEWYRKSSGTTSRAITTPDPRFWTASVDDK